MIQIFNLTNQYKAIQKEIDCAIKTVLSRGNFILGIEVAAFEKEFLGIYLTSHPQMDNLVALKTVITHELDILADEAEGQRVVVGGIIENYRKIFTKKTGSEMAFITIGDEKGLMVESIVFPKIYEKYKSLLLKDQVVVIEGRIDTKNERPIVIAEKISPI